jgi:O-antigen ligase
MKRLWPALAPALVLVHIALPGTLGTLKQSFFPSGGLLAQQTSQVGKSGQGRLADLGPAFDQLSQDPLFGAGYSTHAANASGFDGQILDDQWLGTLVETGTLGAFAWLSLFVVVLGRLRRAAALDRSPSGWLLTSLTASIAAFGAGMFFFDAFAFIQVTVVFFFLVAIACVLLRRDAHSANRPREVDSLRPHPIQE